MRRLAYLLVLLLVPVVIVATPHVADAAVKVSGSQRVEFGYDKTMWGQWASCSLQAFYSLAGDEDTANQAVKWNSARCETGPGEDITGGMLHLDFQGTTPAGGSCHAESSVVIGADDDPPSGSVSFGLVPVAPDQLCTVATLCWSIVKDSGLPFADRNSTDEAGCVPADMGVPVMPGASGPACPSGAFLGGKWLYNDLPWQVYYEWYFAPGTTGSWRIGVIVRNTDGTYEPIDAHVGYPNPPTTVAYPVNGGQLAGRPVVGVWGQGGDGNDVAKRGWNEPDDCRFYFGEKWLDDGNFLTDHDEPSGPMGVPGPVGGGDDDDPAEDPTGPATPVDDEGCGDGFSIWNPLSWASAGFCEVVSALSTLIRAIGKLVKDIADAITALLKDLLWPHPDTWRLDELLEQADQRPPFSLAGDAFEAAGDFGDTYAGAGSNCGTAAGFPIIPGQPDSQLCGQTFKTGYGAWLYGIVAFGLVGLTGWGMAQMLVRRASRGA